MTVIQWKKAFAVNKFLPSLWKLTGESFTLKEIHRKCEWRKMCVLAFKTCAWLFRLGCHSCWKVMCSYAVTMSLPGERVCVCVCLCLWVCVYRCICVAYLSPNGAGIIKGQALLFWVNTGLKICSSLSTIPSSAWMIPKEEHALLSTRPWLCVWPCVCCPPLTTLPFCLYSLCTERPLCFSVALSLSLSLSYTHTHTHTHTHTFIQVSKWEWDSLTSTVVKLS